MFVVFYSQEGSTMSAPRRSTSATPLKARRTEGNDLAVKAASPRPASSKSPRPTSARPSSQPRPSAGAASPRGGAARSASTTTKDSAGSAPSTAVSGHSTRPVHHAVIFVGTYHNTTAAYQLRKAGMSTRFTHRSHIGSVIAVASCSRFLVSAGADEAISVQSVKENASSFTDLGKITPPAQINAMVFPDPRFLVCALETGQVIVYKTREWTCAAVVAAHEKAATGVACHKSGALAVSIGNDFMVCIIDLTRGTVITRRKLDKSLGTPAAVAFSPQGSHFVVQTRHHVSIFDVATATEVARAGFEKDPRFEIQCMTLTHPLLGSGAASPASFSLLAGIENGSVHVLTFDADTVSANATTEETSASAPSKLIRPKFSAVTLVARDATTPTPAAPPAPTADTEDSAEDVTRPRIRVMSIVDGSLFTATSQGLLQVFDLSADKSSTTLVAAERTRMATGGRVTSMSILKRAV
jgi:WD40 repeat protein